MQNQKEAAKIKKNKRKLKNSLDITKNNTQENLITDEQFVMTKTTERWAIRREQKLSVQ